MARTTIGVAGGGWEGAVRLAADVPEFPGESTILLPECGAALRLSRVWGIGSHSTSSGKAPGQPAESCEPVS
jgi:hypothetical protein